MVEDHGGECGKEVRIVQESFSRSILYGYGEWGIKDGFCKFGSREHNGGAIWGQVYEFV